MSETEAHRRQYAILAFILPHAAATHRVEQPRLGGESNSSSVRARERVGKH
jgi:hypothetical protein